MPIINGNNKLKFSNLYLKWPKIVTALIFGFSISIVLAVCLQEYNNKLELSKLRLKQELISVKDRMVNLISANELVLKTLQKVIYIQPNLAKDQFNQLISPLIKSELQISHIALAPDLIIKYIYPYAPNQKAIDLNYKKNKKQYVSVKKAMDSNTINLTGPVNLVQGGIALIYRVPIVIPSTNKPWGIISSIIKIDGLMKESGISNLAKNNFLQLVNHGTLKKKRNNIIWGDATLTSKDTVSIKISIPSGMWLLTVTPKNGWQVNTDSINKIFTLGICLSFMISLSAFYIFRGQRKIFDTEYNLIRANDSLLKSEIMFRGVIESAMDGIILVDDKGIIILANPSALKITGYNFDELVGQPIEVLVPMQYSKHKAKRETFTLKDKNRSMGGGPDITLCAKDGSKIPVEISLSNVVTDQQRIIVAIIQDITTRKQHEEKIVHQANFDCLTNLPNRFLLIDRLIQMLRKAEDNKSFVAVIFIDLDDFKKVNDSLGHRCGDSVLIEVAQRLSLNTRDYDTVGHLGSDEFIVLLNLTETYNLYLIVEHLIAKFKKPFKVESRELTLTISIGIAIFPDDGVSAAELIQKSETAMYHSKGAGRNTYTSFIEKMSVEVLRRLTVEEQLRNALELDELEVYYQPKIDIVTDKIMGAEALLRWNNKELGSVSPEEFIPIAEETGLIIDIGMFVFSEALSQTQKWHNDFDTTFSIAINLSPSQFKDTKLTSSLKDILTQYNISPSAIELEITEGVLLINNKQVDKAINELSDLGVNIAMDDFGTGYSSLSYLRKYPFNILKIDRSFINDLTDNSQDRELVNSAIAMAHGLNIKVVAEGVETKEQLDYLKVMGCDYGQGYLFSRPIPSSEMSALLKNKGVWCKDEQT